jgi:hypothetical protein
LQSTHITLLPAAAVAEERMAHTRAGKRRGGSVRIPDEPAKSRLVRGTRAIGQRLGLNADAAWYLLTTKQLPGRKLGKYWVVTEDVLDAYVRRSHAAPLDEPDLAAQTAPARAKRWDKRKLLPAAGSKADGEGRA